MVNPCKDGIVLLNWHLSDKEQVSLSAKQYFPSMVIDDGDLASGLV